MPDETAKVLSADGRKALDEFRNAEFLGNMNPECYRAVLAVCAAFNIEFSEDMHLRPNRANPDYASTQAAVNTFVDATSTLLHYMERNQAPFDIHHMKGVINQREAKSKVGGQIMALTQEIQDKFPDEYAIARRMRGGDEREVFAR
jgi:hypothetical protein